MSGKLLQFPSYRQRGFTLIEILVTVAIIIILVAILLAVGSGVHKNSQINSTRAELASLAGLVEQFERDNNTNLPTTLYKTDGVGGVALDSSSPSNPGNVTFVDLLYRVPAIKLQLDKLSGGKIKADASNRLAILDSFGNPISFIAQKDTPAGWTPTTKAEYLVSSGPDGITVWGTQTDAHNADDILSTDVPH